MFGTEARDALYDIIRMRRDVRAEFSGERLDEETLMRILRAAHHAPSVGNTQPGTSSSCRTNSG